MNIFTILCLLGRFIAAEKCFTIIKWPNFLNIDRSKLSKKLLSGIGSRQGTLTGVEERSVQLTSLFSFVTYLIYTSYYKEVNCNDDPSASVRLPCCKCQCFKILSTIKLECLSFANIFRPISYFQVSPPAHHM